MIRNAKHQPYPGAKATAADRPASAKWARRAGRSSMAHGAETPRRFAPCGAVKLEGRPAVGLRLDQLNFDSQD